MSAATIKAAVRTLLMDNIPELVSVHTEYQLLNPKSLTPQAIIYDTACEEKPQTRGTQELNWRILTHLVQYGTVADVAIYGTDTYGGDLPYNVSFTALCDRVRKLYRAHNKLDDTANTDTSRVLKWAMENNFDRPPPEFGENGLILHQAVIAASCLEVENL